MLALRTAPAFLLVAALSLGAGQAASRDVTIGVGAPITAVDPHFITLVPNNAGTQHIFDRLIHQDENQRLVPGLAVAWRALDNLTWEIKLREGVTFHDGAPFTADDVVFTFERVPKVVNSPASFTIYTKPVKQIVVVDPHTLRMTTASPTPLLPNLLASLPIIGRRQSADAATGDFNSGKAAIGTGPYRFVEFVPGDRLVVTRNADWWGPKQPWSRVTIRMMPNDGARLAALKSGDADLIDSVTPHDVAELARNERLLVASKPSLRVIFLALDQGRAETPFVTDGDDRPLASNPLRDLRVRRALSLAINRAAIVERVLSGHGAATGQLMPAGAMGHHPALQPDRHDADKARKLLTEAGYPNGFKLTLHGPNDRYVMDDQIVQAIAQMWARIGVRTQVTVLPSSAYFGRSARNEFSLQLLGWSTGTGEPDSPMTALIASIDAGRGRGTANRSLYANPEFDRALDAALAAIDPAAREQLYRRASEIAIGDLAILPLHHQVNIWATRRGLAYNARSDERTMAMELRPVAP
jgi:peptide/nickel transport system substrate-binding protein